MWCRKLRQHISYIESGHVDHADLVLFVLARFLVDVTTCRGMVGFPHTSRAVLRHLLRVVQLKFSSDTVCLEIGSGSAGWGLSPTKQILTHLWCQLQVQVLTCTSDQLAESNMLMIQLRNLTFKECKQFPFIMGCSVLSWQIYVL